jgi:hypothetical protein
MNLIREKFRPKKFRPKKFRGEKPHAVSPTEDEGPSLMQEDRLYALRGREKPAWFLIG